MARLRLSREEDQRALKTLKGKTKKEVSGEYGLMEVEKGERFQRNHMLVHKQLNIILRIWELRIMIT